MKRLLRYVLLIALVLMIGFWLWSASHHMDVTYADRKYFSITLSGGKLVVMTCSTNPEPGNRLRFEHGGFVAQDLSTRLGLEKPRTLQVRFDMGNGVARGKAYSLPLWTVFAPLMLVTMLLWYPLLKAWWRGTSKKGFEVELKDKTERQGAKSAKE